LEETEADRVDEVLGREAGVLSVEIVGLTWGEGNQTIKRDDPRSTYLGFESYRVGSGCANAHAVGEDEQLWWSISLILAR
jgi:hypothetical protein